jgi:outer membrane receptor protein involved in Fe transport
MFGLKIRRALLATAAAILSVPSVAHANVDNADADMSATPTGSRKLEPDFFAAYAPVTALDMVRRIPGFSIDQGEGRRGFGENAGNVLIDGDRPSTKSDDIATILSRIPASQVAFISLSEQAGADTETQGQGQVINVVRKRTAKVNGTYEATIVAGTRYGFRPSLNTSATMRRGDTSYELNFSSYSERVYGYGPEDFKTASGGLVERRSYTGKGGHGEAALGGAIKTRVGGAKLNLNGQVRWDDKFDIRNAEYSNAALVRTGTEFLRRDGPIGDLSYELGGDIEFSALPKTNTKIVGLYRTGDESSFSSIETARMTQPVSLFETRSRNTPTEAVIRMQNDLAGLGRHAVQFGAEMAYNRLDARFSVASSVAGAVTTFPASNVLVEETRFEPFFSDVWTLGPAWKIEAGAIAEFSKLTLSGDSTAERSFTFIKPRAIATWTISPQTTLELRAERQVAQLNFDEFATSVDVTVGNQVDAGNADLVPEKTTTLSTLIRHKFLDRGSIQFRGDYQLVSDTQDLVPITVLDAAGNITAQFDGTGNIGKSKKWNGELEITLPLDWLTKPIGFAGVEVRYVGHYHGSRVTDPVTGLNRRVSHRPLWHQEWDIRHDIADLGLVYGASFGIQDANFDYFFNEKRRQKEGTRTTIFMEYSKFKLGTIRFQLTDMAGFRRDRFIYAGTRASGTLGQIVNRERRLDPLLQLSLSGKF